MRVLKFGGTSVADAQRVVNVSEIAINTAIQVQTALVLSAPAGVTNILVSMVKSALAGSDCKNEFGALDNIIRPLINTLDTQYPNFDGAKVMAFYEETVKELKRRVEGITLLGSCPDAVAAFIECRGEALSIAIMAELLTARQHLVQVIDPVQILVCDGKPLESSVDIAASSERFARLSIDPKAIILMSGFCGGDRQGQLVLLGRNGSDYSAACLAAVAKAQCCEIWTDVDGVYSCDPRTVPDAVLLRRMSYKEAMELSYFGAKVLHPRTIAPIAQYRIPCLIKNTLNPQGEGTLISDETDRSLAIKGISDLKNVSMINVSGPGMKGMVGMAGRLFTCISRAGVSIVLITQSSSEYSISFCVHSEDAFLARAAIEEEFALELQAQLLDPIEILDNKAIISVPLRVYPRNSSVPWLRLISTSTRLLKAAPSARFRRSSIIPRSLRRSIAATPCSLAAVRSSISSLLVSVVWARPCLSRFVSSKLSCNSAMALSCTSFVWLIPRPTLRIHAA